MCSQEIFPKLIKQIKYKTIFTDCKLIVKLSVNIPNMIYNVVSSIRPAQLGLESESQIK